LSFAVQAAILEKLEEEYAAEDAAHAAAAALAAAEVHEGAGAQGSASIDQDANAEHVTGSSVSSTEVGSPQGEGEGVEEEEEPLSVRRIKKRVAVRTRGGNVSARGKGLLGAGRVGGNRGGRRNIKGVNGEGGEADSEQ
jgi:hypothetical protein